MTLLSLLLSWFPPLVLLLACGCCFWLLTSPSLFSCLALFADLYVLPLLVYHIHQFFYPIPLGLSDLKAQVYNPWWGSQQIQLIYNTFPSLEKVLHLIPGVFSCWLRLWGAKIGRQVYWVPSVMILDRGLLEVGDGVIFGHLAGTSSHIVKPKGDKLLVYVQKVTIGNHVLVGGEARLSPGAQVADGALIPYRHTVFPGEKFPAPAPALGAPADPEAIFSERSV